MKNNRFAGSLRKANVNYYFEVSETKAYIEKTFVTGGKRENEHYGNFTVEQARKCYRALLAQGFKPYDEESKGSSPVFERLSKGGYVDTLTYTFQTYANDGHKIVYVTATECVDNSDCNAPDEFYTKSKRTMSREEARQFYKDCLNAGFEKPWRISHPKKAVCNGGRCSVCKHKELCIDYHSEDSAIYKNPNAFYPVKKASK